MKLCRWILRVVLCMAWSIVMLGQTPGRPAVPGNIIVFDAPGAGKAGGQGTSPQAINDNGDITGYYKDAASVLHGFVRHRDGTFTSFDVPGASRKATLGTYPQSINKDGEIAGYFFTDPNGVRHGFIRHADGTITKFDPPGSAGTVARIMNDLGQFTGNYVSYDVAHAFIAGKDKGFTTFDPPGSANTAPQSINGLGEITGYYADAANSLHGFLRRKDGTFTSFDVPGASSSEGKGTLPMNINMGGEIVGYYHTGPQSGIHGFLRKKDGTIIKFDPPGSITDNATHVDEEGYILRPATAPLSVNESGDIAGYYGDTAGVVRGFVRRVDGTFITIEAPGATRSGNLGTFADCMNNSGDVAGYFYAGTNAMLRGFLLSRSQPRPVINQKNKQ